MLGRLATEVARILRGKHRPIFAPHLDTGDHVIVVNAAKVVLTADKADEKFAYRHSGYPGGLQQTSYAELLDEQPEEVVRRAVRGMLPKGTPRPPAAGQAEGLRRPRPPPRRPGAPAARPAAPARRAVLSGDEDDSDARTPRPRPPAAASRPSPASASAPARATITINKRPFEDYFPSATHRMVATEPLRVASTAEAYDIDATIDGGGMSGQAGALRLGIARALIELDPELRAA